MLKAITPRTSFHLKQVINSSYFYIVITLFIIFYSTKTDDYQVTQMFGMRMIRNFFRVNFIINCSKIYI